MKILLFTIHWRIANSTLIGLGSHASVGFVDCLIKDLGNRFCGQLPSKANKRFCWKERKGKVYSDLIRVCLTD